MSATFIDAGPDANAPSTVVSALTYQAKACELLDAPLTAALMRAVMEDYQAGGVSRKLLADWEGRDPMENVLGLRIVGALHNLVLTGHAPALATYYPNVGGEFRMDGLWDAAEEVLRTQWPALEAFMRNTAQTNEVRRTGALIGGFMLVAGQTGLPLRCLEVGASAGLNLRWDRFHYDFGNGENWGDPASPVRINTQWIGNGPDTSVSLSCVERAGCDISPIDISRPGAADRLKSYVWPEHTERFQALEGALALAADHPVTLETADAGDWTVRKLAGQTPGMATVVYHSLAAQYFPPATKAIFESAIRQAGENATPEAPVAWLRMEMIDARNYPELRLTLWPGGDDRLIGFAQPHGAYVTWGDNP
ncbi:DUF2332 domain-containing protein [Iodidimonas sp. SYSU 1G8]|uniref:DUF2332 domain-containing protein n=1 Tax=Iodidimonas sp. SYSU 1G8 TaxID=3133967 RepID=UPI0031FE640A